MTTRSIERDELVATAVVGTGRRPVTGPDGDPLSDAATWQTAHLHRQLTRTRAGVLADRPVPDPAPAVTEPLPVAPDTWTALCRQLRARNRTPLLVAALGDLADAGFRLPDREAVPVTAHLVRGAVTGQENRTALLRVLGENARTVVLRNPVWHRALLGDGVTTQDPDTVWETGSTLQRADLLRAERTTDPETARERLAGLVGTGSAKERDTLLSLWEDAPVAADLPVIEQFATDRSKTVRATAHRILLHLTGSTVRTTRETEAAGVLEQVPDAKARRRLEELVGLTDPQDLPRIFGRDVAGVLAVRPALVTQVLTAALAHGRFDVVADLTGKIAVGDLPAAGELQVPDLAPEQQGVLTATTDLTARLGYLGAWSRWSPETTAGLCADLRQLLGDAKKQLSRYVGGLDLKVLIDQVPFRAPALADLPDLPGQLRELAALPQAQGWPATALLAAAGDHALRGQMADQLRL